MRSIAPYAVAVGTLAALAATAPASAQGRPPIAVQSCTVLQAARAGGGRFWFPGRYGGLAPYTDGITISYVNRASEPAMRVAFMVNYRGDTQRVIDAGSFAPGAPITHTFGQFSGDAFEGANPNSCRVVAVRFASGRVWRAGGV
jgi:hypothetical protein